MAVSKDNRVRVLGGARRVVRIEPALNIPDALIDEVLEILEETLKEVDRGTSVIVHDEDDD